MITPPSGGRVYRRLLSYVWPYRYAFMLAILGNILYGIVDASLIKLLEPLLNEGFVSHNSRFLRWFPVLIIGIFIIRGLATFCSTFFMGWVGRHVVMNFRQAMFAHLLKLPTAFYDKTSSGEMLAKIIYNVEQVADASSDALTVLVRETCTALGLLGVMLSINWRLTLLFMVTTPLMAGVMHWVSRRMRMVSGRVQESIAEVTHVAEEAIEGQKVIKAFGGQAYETERFQKVTQNNRRQEMKLIATSALSIPFIQFIGSIALALTIYLATLSSDHILKTAITPGAFAAMMAALIAILKPIKQLTKVNGNIQKGIAGAASIFAFLDEKPEIDEGQHELARVKGDLNFRRVSFSYGEEGKILKEISFDVKAGETIAIVGRSGAGKTTLVNLLPRFYEAQGEILLDGVNVKSVPLAQLRSQIAVVSQHVTLFNDTIANNIAYGCPTFSRAEIEAAARSAYALEFIERLPQGFESWIGENGVRLSGGQRQRLALARAILKKAPILILDEATSALDTESERQIQAVLEKLMAQCTTLVIAHRLSTIENADRILVMDKGQVVEIGSHAQLLTQEGLYASLRTLQYASANHHKVPVG